MVTGSMFDDYEIQKRFVDIGEAVIDLDSIESISNIARISGNKEYNITMKSGKTWTVYEKEGGLTRAELVTIWTA